MIHLKTYEKFQDIEIKKQPLEMTADMNTFNQAERDIKDFQTRKNLFLNIYKTYTDDDKSTGGMPIDLYNKLLQAKFIKATNPKSKIVFLNSLFGLWSEYCKKVRELQDFETTLTQKQKDLAEKQSMLNSNQGDRESTQKDITNIQQDIRDGNEKVGDINTQIAKLKKSSDDELKLKIKNLTLSKKRITQLKTPV